MHRAPRICRAVRRPSDDTVMADPYLYVFIEAHRLYTASLNSDVNGGFPMVLVYPCTIMHTPPRCGRPILGLYEPVGHGTSLYFLLYFAVNL